MTAVPFAWMPMPTPEPERRAALRPRNDVSAVCFIRTTRAVAPPSVMPPISSHRIADRGWPAMVWKSLMPNAGLTPITTSRRSLPTTAGPIVIIGIVDGAEDTAATDNGRRLQIVAGNAQSYELQEVLRLLREAAPG